MVKRVTTGKRDREKLKEQKRKEKQKRKEERQSSATNSFEDMIAYVDEHGQFSDTPPEKPKEEISAEDIAISIPKQTKEEEAPLSGIVEYFNTDKGYGFIRDTASAEKYFFHISSAPAEIAEGNKVTFETERGLRGINAVMITIINNL